MAQAPDPALCVIGAGRVGSVLAYHFFRSNIHIRGIIEKNEVRHSALKLLFPDVEIKSSPTSEAISQSRMIFISVPDDHLEAVSKEIVHLELNLSQKIFVHTSGAHPSEILNPVKEQGGLIASAHPIYSFGTDDPASISLEGVYFDLEGDAAAVNRLEALFQRTGIKCIEITADQKLAVHLASVFYSNYYVGLAHIAQKILRLSHFRQENFWEPFTPLIKSTLGNLSSNSPAEALTGPIKRGDILTVEKHLNYLKSNYPDALPAYIQMALAILRFTSLNDDTEKELVKILGAFDQHPSQ